MRFVVRPSSSDSTKPLGLAVQEAGAVDEIHADDAERLLLRGVLEIEHAHVDHDLLARAAGLGLKLHAHPAVTLVVAAEAARRHRVREREERGLFAALRAEALEVQALLVVEHCFQALAAHVPTATAVDRVADLHVVGRDALRDRARGTAREEKPAHDLLARADLGERAVEPGVEIDLQGLFARRDGMCDHVPLSFECGHAGRECAARANAHEVGRHGKK